MVGYNVVNDSDRAIAVGLRMFTPACLRFKTNPCFRLEMRQALSRRLFTMQKIQVSLRAASTLLLLVAASGRGLAAHPLSDGGTRDLDASGAPIAGLPADAKIEAALHSISAEAVRRDIAALVAFKNRSTLSTMTPNLPPHTGAAAASDWLFAQYTAISKTCGGCLEVKRDTFTEQPMSRIPVPTTITNVYAVLKGTDAAQGSRTVLVTGHYDSRVNDVENTTHDAPGANDDASGVAVSLESARALAKLHFPATIIFAAVAGEEQGLNGSRHLATFLKSQGVDVEAALNNDIVGGNTTPGEQGQDKQAVRLFSEGIPSTATPEQVKQIAGLGYESDSPSRELARAITGIDSTYFGNGAAPSAGTGDKAAYFHPVLEFRRDRFLRGGDHTSFNAQGFAAVRFTEWREDFNHQHQEVRVENGVQFGDLIQYVDMDYVARVAQLNAAALATLAAAPPPPTDVKVVTSNLDNNSILKWQPGVGAPADTRYQILWRELASPDWQFFADASKFGSGNTATLPISKDNVIFGIRALDPEGHASYAVVPYPVR